MASIDIPHLISSLVAFAVAIGLIVYSYMTHDIRDNTALTWFVFRVVLIVGFTLAGIGLMVRAFTKNNKKKNSDEDDE